LCSFQGALLQFGFLASTFWWAIIAFNMCLELFFNAFLKTRPTLWKWIRLGVFNTIGWGISFLFMLIPTSADRMAFSPNGTYCFLSPEDNNAWSTTFFFVPVGISLLVGITCFLIALVRLLIATIKLRKLVFVTYWRLIIFIFIFLFIYSFIFSYVITTTADSSDISDGYASYFVCLIAGPSATITGSCESTYRDEKVSNYNLTMLKGFAVSCLGVLLFFNFITTALLLHWYRLCKALVMVCQSRKLSNFQKVFHLITNTTLSTSVGSVGTDDEVIAAIDSAGDFPLEVLKEPDTGESTHSSESI